MFGPWQHVTQRLKAATEYYVRHRRARGARHMASTDEGLGLTSHRFHRERRTHWIIPALSLITPALAVTILGVALFERYRGKGFHTIDDQAPLVVLFVVCPLLIARSVSALVSLRMRVIATIASASYPLWLLFSAIFR